MTERKETAISVGFNEKGGMDDIEFEKYMKNNIMPLFPDALDIPGKRVLVKVDSGPGRCNLELLAELRVRGWYLYPGVPNTTAVSQETDRNYGPFKTQFRNNLAAIVAARLAAKKSVSLQPWLVGLIVFGGVDEITGFDLTDCAFSRGFSREACLNAWRKVGAAPLTRSCLSDPKVSTRLGEGSSDFDDYLRGIQSANDLAVHALTNGGYRGELLKATIEKREDARMLTAPHSKERIDALRKASTHGAKFLATGGSHLTTDDFFLAQQKNEREKEIEARQKTKKKRLAAMKVDLAAKEVIQKRGDAINQHEFGKLAIGELDILLRWHGALASKMTKEGKVLKLKGIFAGGHVQPVVEEWTTDDENKLKEYLEAEVTLGDTALGRQREMLEQQTYAIGLAMSDEKFNHLAELRKRKLDEVGGGDDDEGNESYL